MAWVRRRAEAFLHDWLLPVVDKLERSPSPTPPPPRHASNSQAGRGTAPPSSPPRRAPSPPRPSARRGQFNYAPPHRLHARGTALDSSPAVHRDGSAFRQGNRPRSLMHGGLDVFNPFALLAMASDYEGEFPVLTAATVHNEEKQRRGSRDAKARQSRQRDTKPRGGVRNAPQLQPAGTNSRVKAKAGPAVAEEQAIKVESEGHAEPTIAGQEAAIKAEGHAEPASEGDAELVVKGGKAEVHAELAVKGSKAEGHAEPASEGDAELAGGKAAHNVPDLASELNDQDFLVGSILVKCGRPVAAVAGGVEGCRRGGPGGGSGAGPAGGGAGCGGADGGPIPDGGGGGVGGGGPADGGGAGGGGGPPGGGGGGPGSPGGPPPPQPPYPQRLPYARCQRAGCAVDALFFCSQCGLVCCPQHVCPDCGVPLFELPAPRLSVPQGLWMVRTVREAPCILRRVNMFPRPQFYSI